MPYMKVSMTHKLTDEKRTQFLSGLENALWKIPEKAGVPVIFDLEEGKTFYVRGVKQEEFIHVEVKYFSNFKHGKKEEFTVAAFDAMHDALGTDKEKMMLLITERNTWGAHGSYLDEFVTEFE